MSILINKDTKVITQGITGKTGQFHTRMCREYANGKAAFVAGVNPKKAGEDFEGV
ncbi:TPA: succinate--CoA ligase subunit alpha, partial [Pseudomonas aeruginosa]